MFEPRTWADIHLDRLKANLAKVLRTIGPRVEVMAVIKADGYGHGATQVARAALEAGATRLGVGDSTEAIELRESGITSPIHVLGALVEREIDDVIYHRITPTIHSLDRVEHLDRKAREQGRRLAVHLKIDTGMGRLGVRPESAEEVLRAIGETKNLRLEGIATHLSAPAEDREFTTHQLHEFKAVLARAAALGLCVPKVHAAASAGLFLYPRARFNLVRPGIVLYGIDPFGLAREGIRLEPVLELRSQIVFLKHVAAGARVGYGASYRTPRPTRLATVPIGYNDGYPQPLGGKGAWALVRGVRAPIVGSVNMDYVTIDVGEVPNVRVGDVVTLIGRDGAEEVRVEDLARLAGTIPYAIPCGLGKRVRRHYHSGEEAAGVEGAADSRTEPDALRTALADEPAAA